MFRILERILNHENLYSVRGSVLLQELWEVKDDRRTK